MKERTFIQRAAFAGAIAIPIAAVGSVVLDDEDFDERIRCDGCRDSFMPADLMRGDAGTRWCEGCFGDAVPSPRFDRIIEDDGEPE
jgi:hypothetical protein